MSITKKILTSLVVGLFTISANATQLSYALPYPPGSIGEHAVREYAAALEKYSDGSLSTKIFAMSLLNFSEVPEGIQHGMATNGMVVTAYFPAQFRRTNLLNELSMSLNLSDSELDHQPLAYAGAMSEYILLNCPSCRQEFNDLNQVFLGSGSIESYGMMCSQPVTNLEQAKGARLRISGSQWSRWAVSLEASPLSLPANEIYEALNQGVIDCNLHTFSMLSALSLDEVTTDITVGVPGGVFAGFNLNSMNSDEWRSLNNKQRKALLRSSAVLSAYYTWLHIKEGSEYLDKARKSSKIKVHEASADIVEHTRNFVKEDTPKMAAIYRDEHGIDDAEKLVREFLPILEKWTTLVAESEINNADELADLYWTEVFSKADPANYGMK